MRVPSSETEINSKAVADLVLQHGLQPTGRSSDLLPESAAISAVKAFQSARKRKNQRPVYQAIKDWAKNQFTDEELRQLYDRNGRCNMQSKYLQGPIENAIAIVYVQPRNSANKKASIGGAPKCKRPRGTGRQPSDLPVVPLYGDLYAVRVDDRHANGIVCRLQPNMSRKEAEHMQHWSSPHRDEWPFLCKSRRCMQGVEAQLRSRECPEPCDHIKAIFKFQSEVSNNIRIRCCSYHPAETASAARCRAPR